VDYFVKKKESFKRFFKSSPDYRDYEMIAVIWKKIARI